MMNMNNATISVPVKQQSNVAEQLTLMNKQVIDIFQALEALTAELTMITITQPPAEEKNRLHNNDNQRSMCNLALEIAAKNMDLGMIESRIHAIRKSLDV